MIPAEDASEWKKYLNSKAPDAAKRLGKEFYENEDKRILTALPPTIAERVKSRNHAVIYYGPRKLQLGGDIWVFIDRDTGEVIYILQGK